mmetsp:Transcript_27563/g.32608  ORF Transcript_27563/g.32608 Transcript_27563/m.32608 type:complete len:425 (+) Transcript_27563:65-1339(+)
MASVVSASDWLSSKGFETFSFHNDKVQYVALPTGPPKSIMSHAHFFCIDTELIYWNFFLDFGPLNLGQLYRFCTRLNRLISEPKLEGKTIYFYSGTHPHNRTNAVTLICSWAIIYLNLSPDEVFKPFRRSKFAFFHDATPITCTYNLTVYDCLCGLAKALHFKFFDFNKFNVEEYEHYEQVENGDLNWHQEGKWLAFAGPHEKSEMTGDGYRTLTVDDYGPLFQKKGVTMVVRLNKKYYDERKFLKYGVRVLDLYYLDGSNPPMHILERFLEEVEANEGGIAVHCKAGLGRTGTCIGAYLMKHYKFTAAEVIGWMRICRPGTVIGPQQQFLAEIEEKMWADGDAYREAARTGVHSNSSKVNTRSQLRHLDLDMSEGKVAEEGDHQGDVLRAMRTKNHREMGQGARIQEDSAWRRTETDTRLSRK